MKQTAVKWLEENIDNLIPYISYEISKKFNKLVEQAKEMEKQQIINTWYDCKLSIIDRKPTDAEQYYKETYE